MGKTVRVYGFPLDASAEVVIEFLEGLTGDKTVSLVEIGRRRIDPHMSYVIVKFTTLKDAQAIISLANKGSLVYGGSFLDAKHHHREISPKPKKPLHGIDYTVLHFGCPVSKERFSVLWKSTNVSAKFGSGKRKLYLFLSHNFADYKLELSYENIWQIRLHQSCSQASKFLAVQV